MASDISKKDSSTSQGLISLFPGLLLAILIGLSARYLSTWIPNLGGVTLAILLGLVIGNIFNLSTTYTIGIKFAEKRLLSFAIMLMGLKLEIKVLNELGLSAIFIILIMVFTTIMLGFIFGKLLGLSNGFSLLLGVGNGICGSSAIAAAAPIISDEEEEIGLSIGVVNLLGTFGIFILPLLTYILNLTDADSGLMIGSTLQAVGQVVAAGFSINDEIGKIATVVKMGRILMLGPVVLLLSIISTKNKDKATNKVSIPPFIIGFFIFSLLGSFNILPLYVGDFLKFLSKLLLTIAMAGIGLKIKLSSLVNQGPRALVVGVLIVISQLSLVTILIKFIL
ncbi:YeiH family protein [Orenia marismortui]|uniref:YeiH family protein n=1 Tax=Orenia marismortui TaxID=46469 RepID=UPI000362AF4B|nr:putative sulfate exporter family transporter [Orenia marismortui]